jgi:hypothetical protein
MLSENLFWAVEWLKLLIVIVAHENRALKFAKIGEKILTYAGHLLVDYQVVAALLDSRRTCPT